MALVTAKCLDAAWMESAEGFRGAPSRRSGIEWSARTVSAPGPSLALTNRIVSLI